MLYVWIIINLFIFGHCLIYHNVYILIIAKWKSRYMLTLCLCRKCCAGEPEGEGKCFGKSEAPPSCSDVITHSVIGPPFLKWRGHFNC